MEEKNGKKKTQSVTIERELSRIVPFVRKNPRQKK